jgi:hypothetical protein
MVAGINLEQILTFYGVNRILLFIFEIDKKSITANKFFSKKIWNKKFKQKEH